jgi:hypothetical protein
VLGHCGIPGNEKADELARQSAVMSLLGREPALGIPRCLAREAIELPHRFAWKNLPGNRHGKLFISRPCKKRAEDLLKLSKNQMKMVVTFLMGHTPVKKQLNIMGLFDGDPDCRFCKLETETVGPISYYLLLRGLGSPVL